jgi:hypothetical protein
MNPVFTTVTRRESIPGGSAPAFLLETVTAMNTEFMPLQEVRDNSSRFPQFINIFEPYFIEFEVHPEYP